MAKPFKGRIQIRENDEGDVALLSNEGCVISDFFSDIEYFTDELSIVYNDNNELYALLRIDGSVASDWYSAIEKKGNGLFEVYNEDTEMYALLNSEGCKISDWFSDIYKFKNGFSIVTNQEDQYALINELGQIVSAWVEDSDDLKKPQNENSKCSTESIELANNQKNFQRFPSTSSIDGFRTKIIKLLMGN